MTAATEGDGILRPPAGVRMLDPVPVPTGSRVAIVASRYHAAVVQRLLDGAANAAATAGIAFDDLDVVIVPGAVELPLAAREAATSGRYAAIVALGLVLRGETPHFDVVAGEAARGLTLASLESGVPIALGLLTCDTQDQALARAGGAAGNKGAEAMEAALGLAGAIGAIRGAGSPTAGDG